MMDFARKEFKEFIDDDRDHPAGIGGRQVVFKFPNGYGASLIQTPFSYGGTDGKYEVGVVQFDGDDFKLTYETPITNDVLGYLTEAEVLKTLTDIKALPTQNNQ